jgi:hypothetical protein
MRENLLRRLAPVLALVAVVVGSGCERGPQASATGTVTLNGARLKHRAVLTFVGPDHAPRSTETDERGAFNISDLPPGATTVMVSSIPAGGPATRPLGAPGEPVSGSRIARPTVPTATATQTSEVPAEYGDATHPLLSFTLQDGDNPLDIDLRTKRNW